MLVYRFGQTICVIIEQLNCEHLNSLWIFVDMDLAQDEAEDWGEQFFPGDPQTETDESLKALRNFLFDTKMAQTSVVGFTNTLHVLQEFTPRFEMTKCNVFYTMQILFTLTLTLFQEHHYHL